MSEKINHNCGLCVAHTLRDAYSFIESLQHRGREATGIAAVKNGRIDVLKWKGEVSKFDINDLSKIFPSFGYHTFMGHVRYATKGKKDDILKDAHPHVIGGKIENRGDHIIIADCEMAIVHNGQVDNKYLGIVDKNLLKTGCDSEALLHFFKQKGENQTLKEIPGAYTMAVADKKRGEVMVLRDRAGIRPGVLGLKDEKYCVASEDISFKENKVTFIEDLNPGAVYYLYPGGNYQRKEIIAPDKAHCFFEWNYLADLDSILDGISVRRVRESLGDVLAQEFNPKNIDLVTFLPRCPEVAARSYAKKRGIPFKEVYYKQRGERSFQGSTEDERKKSIDENLYLRPYINEKPVRDFLKGKKIIIIDDSIVRGNNSRRAIGLINEISTKKAYFVSYTPRIGIIGEDGVPRGCMFGVDMPPNDEFIARGRNLEEISNKMNISVNYLSLDGMLKAYEELGMKRGNLCTYCIGGKQPFDNLAGSK